MQASVKSLVSVFTALGVKAASGWGESELKKKLSKLETLSEDGSEIDDEELRNLFTAVRQAQDAGEPIELVAGGGGGGDGEEGEAKPAKKPAKAKKEDGGRSPAKGDGGKDKPAKEERGPGVIDTIVEFVSAASEDRPVTKETIVNALAKRFKDRGKEAMAKTVSIQLPSRLNKERNLGIVRHPDKGGYYIAKKKVKK